MAVAVGGWWRLVAVGGWRLVAVGGGWRLAVIGPWGLFLRAVLNKRKNIWLLKDSPVTGLHSRQDAPRLGPGGPRVGPRVASERIAQLRTTTGSSVLRSPDAWHDAPDDSVIRVHHCPKGAAPGVGGVSTSGGGR